MTVGIEFDEAGLLMDLESAKRNRENIERMRQAENQENESDGRKRGHKSRKGEVVDYLWGM